MKKIIYLLLVLVSLFGLIVCEKKDKSKNNVTTANKTVELQFAIWDSNQKPGMDAMARDFESKNPNIKINVQVTPWDEYWKKLRTMAASGIMPDIFWMHVDSANEFAASDLLLPLDEYDIDYSPFSDLVTNLYVYKGVHYGVPKDFDTIAMWYNKKLFDEAGVEYPQTGWTWDDFLAKAKVLTNPEKDMYGFISKLEGQAGWYNVIFQNAGEWIKDGKAVFSNENTVEALQWYKDLIYKHKVAPDFEKVNNDVGVQWFQSGKAAMIMLGSWMCKPLKDSEYARENFEVTELPKGKQKATITNGLAYSIYKDTKYQDAAVKFVQYLATEEANIIQGESAAAIPLYKGRPQEVWIEELKEFNVKVYVDGLSYAYPMPYAPGKSEWGLFEQESITRILTDRVDILTGLKQWEDRVNKVIEANQ